MDSNDRLSQGTSNAWATIVAPTIETKSLLLSELCEHDFPDLFEAVSPQMASSGLTGEGVRLMTTFASVLANSMSRNPGDGYYIWIARRRGSNRPVGLISLAEWSRFDATLDAVSLAERRNGLLIEDAMRAVVDWAFLMAPALSTIRFDCAAHDQARHSMLDRCGFRFVRLRLSACLELRRAPRVVSEWAIVRQASESWRELEGR